MNTLAEVSLLNTPKPVGSPVTTPAVAPVPLAIPAPSNPRPITVLAVDYPVESTIQPTESFRGASSSPVIPRRTPSPSCRPGLEGVEEKTFSDAKRLVQDILALGGTMNCCLEAGVSPQLLYYICIELRQPLPRALRWRPPTSPSPEHNNTSPSARACPTAHEIDVVDDIKSGEPLDNCVPDQCEPRVSMTHGRNIEGSEPELSQENDDDDDDEDDMVEVAIPGPQPRISEERRDGWTSSLTSQKYIESSSPNEAHGGDVRMNVKIEVSIPPESVERDQERVSSLTQIESSSPNGSRKVDDMDDDMEDVVIPSSQVHMLENQDEERTWSSTSQDQIEASGRREKDSEEADMEEVIIPTSQPVAPPPAHQNAVDELTRMFSSLYIEPSSQPTH